MYDLFNSAYDRDLFEDNHLHGPHTNTRIVQIENPEYLELLKRYEGASFNNGVYRIVRSQDISLWIDCIASIFPDFSKRILPFGYDWLGRFYCLDLERIDNSKPLVLLFSGFTNEVMEIPANIVGFHNSVLIDQSDAALETKSFLSFLNFSRATHLSTDHCIDMVVPLYMGGTYTVENMKLAELQISWEINAQLLNQLKTVSEGTRIKKVSVC